MRWAKAAVVLGSLLLAVGFWLGVETPITTTVAGQSHACADVITPGMLVAGSPSAPESSARGRAACAPLERAADWAVWSGITLGSLIMLIGGTALREHAEAARAEGRAVIATQA